MNRQLSSPTTFLGEMIDALLHRAGEIAGAWVKTGGYLRQTSAAAGRGRGCVWFVGAGPGDPELITLKALRVLREADHVLHDRLVSKEVLDLIPAHVERIDVGKAGYGHACAQSDINALMVGLAKSGLRVVRLKAGDPLMFGRLEEEIGALDATGIPFEIIAGISAAQGAAAALGFPLTRRRGARRFQAITGHACDGRLPDDFDWAGLTDPKATTAVYMPKATVAALCAALAWRGLPANHPAVAVFNATRADQCVISATLATLPEQIVAADSGAPCILLLGASIGSHIANLCATNANTSSHA